MFEFADLDAGTWWLIAGVLLLALELLAPGVFLVFIGAAALATGAFTLMFDLGLAAQLGLFALYTAVSVYIGKKIYARPVHDESDGLLNERAAQLVGRKVTVVRAIGDGEGRVKVGDSEWNARGDFTAEAGEKVVISGIQGNCLIVERAPALPGN
ncbi:NfeD family protein [Sphingomicrobium clamense]|uniref:NfeD family protein n=1 Tax=Sphingomicrobium clamense TaxID=2851013 RepID=A0ABS6V5Z2_9SPHN|nr:NfeD family protein [Sphingomicrobium sp. B8]MBW0144972.1 NfeD family protein [Sphingomicrobium sp. B8]